jgi:hypothetical protein
MTIGTAGCGNAADTTNSITPPPTGETAGSVADNTTTSIPSSLLDDESREYMAVLKESLAASNTIAAELESSNAPEDDPRVAVIYGLRARGQAVTALKAIHEKQPALADDSFAQLITLLNRATLMETGEPAEILARARKLVEGIEPPSYENAATPAALRRIVDELAPLLP